MISIDKKILEIRSLLTEKMNHKIEVIDLLLSLLLDIIIFEIKTFGSMSDKTGEAIIQIVAFQSIEYYYHEGFLQLDSKLKEFLHELGKYNIGLKEYELDAIGINSENWSDYFKEHIHWIMDNSAEH